MSNAIQIVASERQAIHVRDAANLLGISPRHLWQLDKLERIPRPIRLGRSVRWLRPELEAWLAAGGPPRQEWECTKAARNGGAL